MEMKEFLKKNMWVIICILFMGLGAFIENIYWLNYGGFGAIICKLYITDKPERVGIYEKVH